MLCCKPVVMSVHRNGLSRNITTMLLLHLRYVLSLKIVKVFLIQQGKSSEILLAYYHFNSHGYIRITYILSRNISMTIP